MTQKEATKRFLKYCDRLILDYNIWFLFYIRKKRILITVAKILEPWKKTANLQLPLRLYFEGKRGFTIVNQTGIKFEREDRQVEWKDIGATAIAEHRSNVFGLGEDQNGSEYFLMCCLQDGEIINYDIGMIDQSPEILGDLRRNTKTKMMDQCLNRKITNSKNNTGSELNTIPK